MRLVGQRLNGSEYGLKAGLACLAFIAAKLLAPRLILDISPVRMCTGKAFWVCHTLQPWIAFGARWAITLGFLWGILRLNSARWEDARFPIWASVYPLLFLFADLTWGVTLKPLGSLINLTSAIPPPPLALLAALACTAVLATLPSHDKERTPRSDWQLETTEIVVLALALTFAAGELILLKSPQTLLAPGRALGILQVAFVVPPLIAVTLLPLALLPATVSLASREGARPAIVAASVVAVLAMLAALATSISSLLGYLARLHIVPDTITLMQVRGIAATVECGLLILLLFLLAAVKPAKAAAGPNVRLTQNAGAPARVLGGVPRGGRARPTAFGRPRGLASG